MKFVTVTITYYMRRLRERFTVDNIITTWLRHVDLICQDQGRWT